MNTLKTEPRMARKINAVNLLSPESIIGHNENIGVYRLVALSEGSTESTNSLVGVGKEKFELDNSVDENYMRFSFVSFHIKHLMGEVLTTMEATIHNEKQLNAAKSIVKSYFGRKLDWIYENCSCPEEEQDYLMSIEE